MSLFLQNQPVWAKLKSHSCKISKEILQPNFIKILTYQPSQPEKGKILILPPTNGVTFLEKKYAKQFCKKGFKVFIVHSWQGRKEESVDLNIHNVLLTRGQLVISQIVKEKTNPKDFIGIFGTSVGAIHSATALGSNDRIHSGFFIVGGAPIHKVIVYSKDPTLSKYREKRKQKYGFKSLKEYEEALDKKLLNSVKPLYFKKQSQTKRTFVVIAKKDTTVPSLYQRNLAQAFQSKTLEISGGHISSILRFWLFYRKKASSFFEDSFQEFSR